MSRMSMKPKFKKPNMSNIIPIIFRCKYTYNPEYILIFFPIFMRGNIAIFKVLKFLSDEKNCGNRLRNDGFRPRIPCKGEWQ